MKIYTKIVVDLHSGRTLSTNYYEYEGPIAKCDRAAQNELGQMSGTAREESGKMAANAAEERSMFLPMMRRDLQGNQGLTGSQINNRLTAAEQGAGGAMGGVGAEAERHAAMTHNNAGVTGLLRSLAQAKAGAASKAASAGQVASENLANQRRDAALHGTMGLYGTDTSRSLEAMGLGIKGAEGQVEAGRHGWLQNAEAIAKLAEGPKAPGGELPS